MSTFLYFLNSSILLIIIIVVQFENCGHDFNLELDLIKLQLKPQGSEVIEE